MDFFDRSLRVLNSNIRIIHSVANGPNIDVYANGIKIATDIAFGKMSDYFNLSTGNYEIQLYKSGFYDTPLLTQNLQLTPNSNNTVSVTTLGGNLYLFKLKDDDIQSSTPQAFLRFINLSPNAPLLSLALPNDITLFNSVEYLETTGYYPLSSGIYNFKILISSAEAVSKNIKNIVLDNFNFYTIYVIGLFNDEPPLGYLLVEDAKTTS